MFLDGVKTHKQFLGSVGMVGVWVERHVAQWGCHVTRWWQEWWWRGGSSVATVRLGSVPARFRVQNRKFGSAQVAKLSNRFWSGSERLKPDFPYVMNGAKFDLLHNITITLLYCIITTKCSRIQKFLVKKNAKKSENSKEKHFGRGLFFCVV